MRRETGRDDNCLLIQKLKTTMIYMAAKTTCSIEHQVHTQHLPNQINDRHSRLTRIIRYKQFNSRPWHIIGAYTFSKHMEKPYKNFRRLKGDMLKAHEYFPVPDRWGSWHLRTPGLSKAILQRILCSSSVRTSQFSKNTLSKVSANRPLDKLLHAA